MEDYLGRVWATLWEAADYLSEKGIAEAREWIEHGEPAEGMRSLAWLITEEQQLVPRSLIERLRALSCDLVPLERMPSDLDAWAVADGHD